MRFTNTGSIIISAGCGLFVGAAAISAAYRRREPGYQPPSRERLIPDAENNLAIARRADALTFARYRRGDAIQLMLVDGYVDGKLTGMLLDETGRSKPNDPISLFAELGYEGVAGLKGILVEVLEEELTVPFDGTSEQIAIGGNYPKHAAETAISENFLFPKLNEPGRFTSDVPSDTGLLDHEVELGFVFLQPLRQGSPIDFIGLVLASDYTDRAVLLRSVNPRKVTSGRGFTAAKSRPGYMPVGNLFVIPRNYRSFYKSLEMKLYVDRQLRQTARPEEMVWSIERMVEQAFRDQGRYWEYEGRKISLPIKDGQLAARTMILSGTSDGVILRKPSGRQLALGLLEAALGGFRNIHTAVIEPTIREAQEERRYLQPGMRVVMRADKLGLIRNSITRDLHNG